MAYEWKILSAAVEQEIEFPSREAYEKYINSLKMKGVRHEIVLEQESPEGICIIIMRKPYNNNAFLPKEKEKNIELNQEQIDLAKQARRELEEYGKVKVLCPKCGTRPVITVSGNRFDLRCSCRYVRDGEIYL